MGFFQFIWRRYSTCPAFGSRSDSPIGDVIGIVGRLMCRVFIVTRGPIIEGRVEEGWKEGGYLGMMYRCMAEMIDGWM